MSQTNKHPQPFKELLAARSAFAEAFFDFSISFISARCNPSGKSPSSCGGGIGINSRGY
jgi:hypothetical protein